MSKADPARRARPCAQFAKLSNMFPRIVGFAVAFGLAAVSMAAESRPVPSNLRETRIASSSFPDSFVPIGDQTLFSASTPETGYELWVSDATVERTRLLVDLCPGPCSPQATYPFAELGERVFFGVVTSTGRSELWVTAGTPESTRRLTEGPALPHGGYTYPSWVVFGGRLYFSWRDLAHGGELWSSDGTAEGTQCVLDLRLGPVGSEPRELVPFGNRLAFTANDGVHGRSIFVTDGTTAGTLRVMIPAAGAPQGRFPYGLSSLSTRLAFLYTDGSRRQALWSLAPGARAAEKLFDLAPSFGQALSFQWVVRRGELLFAGRPTGELAGLWTTDGTRAGTRLLHAFEGNVRSLALAPSGGAALGDSALFQLFRGRWPEVESAVRKIELWATDGTSGGTRPLADLCRGECFADNSWIWSDRGHAYVILFSGQQREIWATDGTADGTRKIARGTLDPLGPAGPDFYFSLLHRSSGTGLRLDVWATDGTEEGTRAVTRPPISPVLDFVWPAGHAAGKLLFAGYDSVHGVELWVSDGTEEGTHLLRVLDSTGIDGGAVR